MTYVEHQDAELLELARRGVAPAFAVLVHRYGRAVLDLAAHDEDPVGAATATFVRAMRTLPEAPDDDIGAWLRDHAAVELGLDPNETPSITPRREIPPASTDRAPATSTPVIERLDPELDAVWAELAPRWPDGRRRRTLPSWVLWAVTVLLLLALAVLVPWALLGNRTSEGEIVAELRATVVPDEIEDRTPDEEPTGDPEEEPLPSFEFPEPPDGQGAAASTTPSSRPTVDPDPVATAPVDEPDPGSGDGSSSPGQSPDDGTEADPGTDEQPDGSPDGSGGDEPPPQDPTDPPDSEAPVTDPGVDGEATDPADPGDETDPAAGPTDA